MARQEASSLMALSPSRSSLGPLIMRVFNVIIARDLAFIALSRATLERRAKSENRFWLFTTRPIENIEQIADAKLRQFALMWWIISDEPVWFAVEIAQMSIGVHDSECAPHKT